MPSTPSAVGVELREVTRENLGPVLRLAVRKDQERFVASVAVSIAQAAHPPFEEGRVLVPWYRAIYAGSEPAGFVMLAEPGGAEPDWYLWRFLVDARRQGQGIGRAALALVVDHVRADGRGRWLTTSWVPGEGSPEGFYRGIGFVPTGKVVEDEVVARLPLPPAVTPSG